MQLGAHESDRCYVFFFVGEVGGFITETVYKSSAHDATLKILWSFCLFYMTHELKPPELYATCCDENVCHRNRTFFVKTRKSVDTTVQMSTENEIKIFVMNRHILKLCKH